jgi:hypothetical protein
MSENRLATNKPLMAQAARLPLQAARNSVVLWSGRENRELARQFCEAHAGAGYVTLEMILERYYGTFFRELCALPWPNAEEIWWFLSAKLAEGATGAVRVFAAGVANPESEPGGDVDPELYKSEHKPRGDARAVYCNSVFEKVEGPALDANPLAGPVLMMGRNINAKPTRY